MSAGRTKNGARHGSASRQMGDATDGAFLDTGAHELITANLEPELLLGFCKPAYRNLEVGSRMSGR
jgi:hypothetical protein